MSDVAGKAIWITGASAGIGKGLALALAAKGARLVLSGRNQAALEEVAAQCPGSIVEAFEVTDLDPLPAIAARVAARWPAASPSKHSKGTSTSRQASMSWVSVIAVPSGATASIRPAWASPITSI